jgi:hypothetical protein
MFGLKYLNSLIWVRDEKKFGSGINIPDPQHFKINIVKRCRGVLINRVADPHLFTVYADPDPAFPISRDLNPRSASVLRLRMPHLVEK